ncbi:MAG: TlpA family protein disulfide reductase [Thermoplasmatota archaeon]
MRGTAAAFLGALILLAGCLEFGASGTLGPAPDFRLVSLTGANLTLARYHGTPLILDFMATTCDPCKAMDSVLASVKDSTKANVLSISISNSAAEQEALHSGWNLSWDRALDSNTVFYRYGGKVIPYVVVVDRNGTIRWEQAGETSAATLTAAVDAARAAP